MIALTSFLLTGGHLTVRRETRTSSGICTGAYRNANANRAGIAMPGMAVPIGAPTCLRPTECESAF